MRFLMVLISFTSSISMAGVNDFNGLVKEASQQEKRLHRKLLQSIQGTQVSVAYNDRLEKLESQSSETLSEDAISVRLVRVEEK